MAELELVLPSERYRASYLEAEQEWLALGPLPDGKALATEESFARVLDGIARKRPELLEWWLVADDYYYGKVQIRPGGVPDHVGVSIRPSARQRGFALHALELARPHIEALGLDRIDVITSAMNLAACAVIAHFGGDMVEELPDGVFRFSVRVTSDR